MCIIRRERAAEATRLEMLPLYRRILRSAVKPLMTSRTRTRQVPEESLRANGISIRAVPSRMV